MAMNANAGTGPLAGLLVADLVIALAALVEFCRWLHAQEQTPGREHKLELQPHTVGRTYTGRDCSVHQPSMWLTLTLDSYGPVHGVHQGRPCACRRWHTDTDPELGTPVHPDSYDYRRAAWDAVRFPRLLDRYWQNLRRAIGWNVQYAGCVEPQRRLAPHAHFAIRGTIPRQILERVAAATYHQVSERLDLVPRNVAKAAKPPSLGRDDRRALTAEEARALLETLTGDRLESLFVLALATGLRRGELLGLRWADVDLAGRVLFVRQTLQRSEVGPGLRPTEDAPLRPADAAVRPRGSGVGATTGAPS